MPISFPDAKGLEGKPVNTGEDENSGKITPREFFWDSITLYVAYAIIGLSSIDLIFEFIKQPEVRCFSRNDDIQENISQKLQLIDYINEFCYGTSALSNINIFRIWSYILGFGIIALHSLWVNRFGGRFAFFFQLATAIQRRRDDTGEYPKSNLIIADQLEDTFTDSTSKNRVFQEYFVKLFVQLLYGIIGVIWIAYYYAQLKFETSFDCPETAEEANDTKIAWPLTGEQVTCIYTSFPLLQLICIANLALLITMIVLLSFSLIWCTASHTKELGYKDVAVFVFQTGLPSRYFTPDFQLSIFCTSIHKCLYSCCSFVPWFPMRGPRIKTDLDFMMMRLFRTDGGLGHVLKEVLIMKEVKNLNDDDRRNYYLHRHEQKLPTFRTGDLVKKSNIMDLKWRFDKNKNENEVHNSGVYTKDNHGEVERNSDGEIVFRVPYTIRGAVLGFSSYVQDRTFALCISFGSPSTGFATALARVFSKVVSINFNPYYYNMERSVNKDDTDHDVGKEDADRITTLTCAEDVLSTKKPQQKFFAVFNEVCNKKKVNFVLISPLDKSIHRSTVNFLMHQLQGTSLADDAVVLTICPLAISGRYFSISESKDEDQDVVVKGERDFYQYTPPKKSFPSLMSKVRVINRRLLLWPQFDTEESNAMDEPPKLVNNLSIYVIDDSKNLEMHMKMCFRLFIQKVEVEEMPRSQKRRSRVSTRARHVTEPSPSSTL